MKFTVKLLSAVLVLVMLLSMVACGNTPEETTKAPEGTKEPATQAPNKETEPKETEPVETEPQETEPVETEPKETESETEKVTNPPLPEAQRIPDGTMIFYEDFELVGNVMGVDATFEALRLSNQGIWAFDSATDPYYSKDGNYNYGFGSPAYQNPTEKLVLGVVDGRLAVYGHTDPDGNTVDAKDTYIIMADESYLWEVYQQNYTLQYDVEYVTSKDNKRYINILLNYCGQYYTSYHFRIGGYANLQLHYAGSWKTIDQYTAGEDLYAAGYDYKNGSSVAKKLLGITIPDKGEASEARFANVPVTIRIQVTPAAMADGGSVTVWMKLASDAEFTKISVSSAGTDGAYYFGNYEYSDDIGANGGALALKVGAAINGFVDNIMLWTGHGDVPLDTTVTYIPSAVVEHR